jgi:FAD dependent oxidoreductase TIGR03364
MANPSAIVVGAGILGIAMARALAIRGFSVKVFERTHRAVGASVRNFGMIWPIGQPQGKMYERAMASRIIWIDIAEEAGIWYDPVGSIYLARREEEWEVLQEAHAQLLKDRREIRLLSREEALDKSSAILPRGLRGALFSSEELMIDPREAMAKLPGYLSGKWGVEFYWGKCISSVVSQKVFAGKEEFEADRIFICSGADMETLFPEAFARFPLTKCKLQMMRLEEQPGGWRMGPALCGGLSLIHYKSFAQAPSLHKLKKRFEEEMPEYLRWGIHVMVAQNGRGELTIGDSHEYGPTHDPFDKGLINLLILDYLREFAQFSHWTISETWNGVYPIRTDGEGDEDVFYSPQPSVHLVNGVGGAGMTISFRLAEELVDSL